MVPRSAIFHILPVISGGNRSTRRNTSTCASHWQTLPHNVVPNTHRHEWDPNFQR